MGGHSVAKLASDLGHMLETEKEGKQTGSREAGRQVQLRAPAAAEWEVWVEESVDLELEGSGRRAGACLWRNFLSHNQGCSIRPLAD